YNSRDVVYGGVGHRWRHNLMMSLSIGGTTPPQVTFTSQTGRQFTYNYNGSSWELDTESSYFTSAVLTQVGSNWLLTYPDGSAFGFNSLGLLTSMADRHGNTSTLTYNSEGQLVAYSEPQPSGSTAPR